MQTTRIKPGLVLGAILCLTLSVSAQSTQTILDRLSMKDAEIRQKSFETLVEEGPAVLLGLFERIGGEGSDVDAWDTHTWAKRTAERIVYNTTAPGANKKERAAAEAALLHVIAGDFRAEQKEVALRLIALCGGEASAPVLERQLYNTPIREAVHHNMERIPGTAITKAFLRVYEDATCPLWKAALIKTLGARGDLTARATVLKALSDPNKSVQRTAITAAGHLGDRACVNALWSVWERSQCEECLNAAGDALLHVAEKNESSAVDIYRRICEKAPSSLWKRAGLAGLASVGDRDAVRLAVEALEDDDPSVRGVVLDRLPYVEGKKVTRQLVKALKSAEGRRRLGLVTILGRRDDPAVVGAVKDVLAALGTGDAELRDAAVEALGAFPGQKTTRAIMDAAAQSEPATKARLIEALGKRADRMALPFCTANAKSDSDKVRAAAVGALGQMPEIASASILTAAMNDSDVNVSDAAAQAANPVAKQLLKAGRKEEATALCLKAARTTTDGALIRSLMGRLQTLGASEVLTEMAKRAGCLVTWSIVGPLPDHDRLMTSDLVDPTKPVDVSKPIQVDGQSFSWKPLNVDDVSGKVDFARTFENDGSLGAYLYAELVSDREQNAQFKIGSNDECFIHLNGEKVFEFARGRVWEPDQNEAFVTIKKGVNRILMKVLNSGGAWASSLRITNLDGRPIILEPKR